MKYAIRQMPDVPGIESLHYQIWRPGERDLKLGALRAFATAPTLGEAIAIVELDIRDAIAGITEFIGRPPRSKRVAVFWWAFNHRDDWRGKWSHVAGRDKTA